MVTFDDLVAFGPYLVSIIALFAALYNISSNRPKINIEFTPIPKKKRTQPDEWAKAIGVNITNDGGRPITVFFPYVILPENRSNVKILYLRPWKHEDDVYTMELTPFVWAGNSGKTPAFPRLLRAGMWDDVWIEDKELAAELKKLGYGSDEVNLKVSFKDASKKPHVSKKTILFDVDTATWRQR